jgi:NADH:ubiquinone oxidoreductase subunit 5 (subunit L)/multisubunit Na+/H+ antiporter MnhA subunit
VLAVLALIAGYPIMDWHATLLAPPAEGGLLPNALIVGDIHHFEHVGLVVILASAAGVGGLLLGFFVFALRAGRLEGWKRPFRALETAFASKFWFDELYAVAVVRPAYRLAAWLKVADAHGIDAVVNAVGRGGVKAAAGSGANDRHVVDGLVRFVGGTCQFLGAGLSLLQSGRVRLYLSLSVGAIALVLILERIL